MEAKSYQIELYERAKDGNVIIKLNTGSGKTFIASMLIKDYLNRKINKKIFFLVKNASLAQQHTIYLRQYLFLNNEVDFYHGNMNNSWVDFWTKDKWAFEIGKHKIIIMTARVFLDILNHKKYSLNDVSLLIFDEVHHLTKSDDYAQISEHLTAEFNHVKVLGLTACLVKTIKKLKDIEFYIQEIEMKLNCKIITSIDSIASEFSTNIENVFIDYPDEETEDIKRLRDIVHASTAKILEMDSSTSDDKFRPLNIDGFLTEDNPFSDVKRHMSDVSSVLNSLGVIPCNCIVEIFLKDLPTLMKVKQFAEEKTRLALQEFSLCLLKLQEAIRPILRKSNYLNCSIKVRRLIKYIMERKNHVSEDDQDIFTLIFVTERIHALALNELLNLLPEINDEFKFIKAEFIIGHATCSYPKKLEMNNSVQNKILNRFRGREFNILVATNVVEEGLDIPHCNVVIKFDPPSEFRSYLQSKGRARAQSAQYVIFVKSERLAQVRYSISFFDQINKAINDSLKSRAIDDCSVDDEYDGNEMLSEVNSTDYMPYGRFGPRITLNSASSVLNRYIGKLRCNCLSEIKIMYKIEKNLNDMYQTTLLLPMPSPYLEEINGGYHMSKKASIRYANLEACKILHRLDELDGHLLPYNRYDQDDEIISPKDRGISDISQYEKNIAKKLRSDYQILTEKTSTLYLYSIRYRPQVFFKLGFEDFSAFDMSSSIGFLLPEPIHEVDRVVKFPIYLIGGICSVEIVFEEKISVTLSQLMTFMKCHEALINIYAQRIRKFCANISYQPTESKCPLIITVLKDFKIDIDSVNEILDKAYVVTLTETPKTQWVGSVIRPTYLKKEFGAYVVTKVCNDLNSKSIMKNTTDTYQNYYESKYKLKISEDDAQQPLVSVKRLTTIQSCINKEKRSIKESRRLQIINSRETYFIPSLIECISLSSSVWTHLCIFPTIHLRLNQIFNIQDFTSTVDFMDLSNLPELVDIEFENCYKIERILSTDVDFENNAFLINVFPCFISKTCNDRLDLEQYEILGDSFLKFITSKYLYHFSKPVDSEGKLTQRRSNLISNRNLFKLAMTKELWKYLSFSCFDPKSNYLPPNFVVNSDNDNVAGRNNREFVYFKSKCLADCVEAVIGSIFTNYGIDYAIKFLLWIGMDLMPLDYSGDKFEIVASPPTLFCRNISEDPVIPENIAELERIIKYTFKYKAYAVQAITHPTSIENRQFSCYQRLEYLGDAVLDFLVTSYIMVKNTKLRPGKVTNLRSALVSNSTFAFLSAKWGLHKHLNHFDSKMFFALPEVVQGLLENNLDYDTLFLKKSEQYKVIVKVLGDIFESIAGAIFVDSDYNLDTVWEVYQRLMEEPLKKFSNEIPKNKITLLYEKFPNIKCKYEIEEGTNLTILRASLPDGREIEIKETNKTLCKLSLTQELLI